MSAVTASPPHPVNPLITAPPPPPAVNQELTFPHPPDYCLRINSFQKYHQVFKLCPLWPSSPLYGVITTASTGFRSCQVCWLSDYSVILTKFGMDRLLQVLEKLEG